LKRVAPDSVRLSSSFILGPIRSPLNTAKLVVHETASDMNGGLQRRL
jgi:hypothetical protein